MNTLEQLNIKLKDYKRTLSKGDIKNLFGGDKFVNNLKRNLMYGFNKADKLFLESSIQLGYVYKTFDERDDNKYGKCWILYSPLEEYEKDPSLYRKVLQNLDILMESKKKEKFYKGLKLLENDYYFQDLEFEPAKSDLVTLSTCYYNKKVNRFIIPGLNYILFNRKISKHILLVPEKLLAKLNEKEAD